MKPILVLAVAALAFSCCAHAQTKAQIFSGNAISSQLAALEQEAKSSGSSGGTLGDYTSHAIKLSVRANSGGAEVHAHYDDVFFVTDGKATLITGGTVVNPKTSRDGETMGSSIRGGESQTIAKGDVVHIPAGTPHQLIIARGAIYSSIVIKVREP